MAEERTTRITAYDNGPFLVQGPAVIMDAEGNEYQTEK